MPNIFLIVMGFAHSSKPFLSFCVIQTLVFFKHIDEALGNIFCHLSGISTDIHNCIFLYVILVNILRVLHKAVLYVNLLCLFPRESGMQFSKIFFLNSCKDFVLVQEIDVRVATSKEQSCRSQILILVVFSPLEETTERSKTSSWPDHNNWGRRIFWQLKLALSNKARHNHLSLFFFHFSKPSGTNATVYFSFSSFLWNLDHHRSDTHNIWVVLSGTRDRVKSRVKSGGKFQEHIERGTQRLKLIQHINNISVIFHNIFLIFCHSFFRGAITKTQQTSFVFIILRKLCNFSQKALSWSCCQICIGSQRTANCKRS
mmetsp:Transcript_25362/g.35103  ORF Transcript_25362/g.35103 Transcript_25362/m.35103 type:complete len:315 (-) Transcript_25362:1394-2338(-)